MIYVIILIQRNNMGNFFTSSQIFNGEGLDKQQFIDKFCKAMADSGYVVCDSDEGEKSYILRFDADSKWVAITYRTLSAYRTW